MMCGGCACDVRCYGWLAGWWVTSRMRGFEGGGDEVVVSPVGEQGGEGAGCGNGGVVKAAGEGGQFVWVAAVANRLDGGADFFFGAGAFEGFGAGEPGHAFVEWPERSGLVNMSPPVLRMARSCPNRADVARKTQAHLAPVWHQPLPALSPGGTPCGPARRRSRSATATDLDACGSASR